ncbi:MAG: hypothetical protein WC568_08945 [Candidatus Methanoperedens sp.]
MEINLGNERIVVLQATYTADQIREKALSRRVDVFGRVAKLIQRIKPEDIEITVFQKRFEPFWFASASTRYVYDRKHTYRVGVSPEVQAVTVYGNKHAVAHEQNNTFELEAMERCVEEFRKESSFDAMQGNEADFSKYLTYPKTEVPEMAALKNEGSVVVPPEVRGSFVVRKLVQMLIKTIQADKIHEEKIDIKKITLFYRPVYAVEYYWKAKNKKLVVEFDALTGETKVGGVEIKKQVAAVLENNTLFDFGADAVGILIPGANLAVKLGRLAAKKVIS